MIVALGQVAGGLLRLGAWLVVLVLVFIPLERRFGRVRQPILRRRWREDLGFYFLNGILPPLLILIPLGLLTAIVRGIGSNGFYVAVASLPLAVRLLAAVVVGEIGAYWGHRLSHEIPWLWRIHAVHHSAEQLDWLVNSRAHPLDFVVTRSFGLAPVLLLGLAQPIDDAPDLVLMLYVAVGTLWSYLVHANLRWRFGVLEHLVATPAFHHWHHANDDRRHINHNYAAIFPWVDRLFGTLLSPSRRWPGSYGLAVADGLNPPGDPPPTANRP
jgi:sterol desaturase/sphingolipid hydroxylase (fatty acid hydroxylase superfamily)